MKVTIFEFETGRLMFTADVHTHLGGNSAEGRAVEWAIQNGFSIKGADLRGTSFIDADLRKADFTDCWLTESLFAYCDLSDANFTNANLRDSSFRSCTVSGTDFMNTSVRGCKFSETVLGHAIIPEAVFVDDLDGKILTAIDAGGTLNMNHWHKCKTTHCRAGWAIVMAGIDGHRLEEKHGPQAAGAMIYAKSYPNLPVPSFYSDNDKAMDDMRSRAVLAV